MTNCTPITRKPFRVCIGAMKRKITLYTRSISAPSGSSVDYGETLSSANDYWSMIETVTGETVFDDTNTERVVTHNFYIRYIPSLTFEAWLKHNGKYYDILGVENLDQEYRFMLIKAALRGPTGTTVNIS